MTLQINEVGIRMRVGDEAGTADPFGTNGEDARSAASGDLDGCGDVDKEAIIQEAVRRTLRVLRASEGR